MHKMGYMANGGNCELKPPKSAPATEPSARLTDQSEPH